jgi:hypothetical protein
MRIRPAPPERKKAAAQYGDWSSGFLSLRRRWPGWNTCSGRATGVSHVIRAQRLVPGEQVVAADLV